MEPSTSTSCPSYQQLFQTVSTEPPADVDLDEMLCNLEKESAGIGEF